MKVPKVSRRSFLRLSAASAIGVAAGACAPPPVSQPGPAQGSTSAPAPAEAGAAPAPTQAPAAPANAVKISFWDMSQTPAEIENLDKAYLKFNEIQQAVQVEVLHGKDEQAVLAAVAAGSPPDVYWRWAVDTYGGWINKKIIQDLTPFVEASQLDWKRFVPVSLEAMQWRGKYYGLPLTSAGVGLYYWNKPLMQKAGLDPEKPPQTLDEVMTYAEKLTVRGSDGSISTMGFHFGLGHLDWPALFNGNFWDPKAEKLTPTDPGLVAAYKWVANWYKTFGVEAVDTWEAGLPSSGYWSESNPLCKDLVTSLASFEWEYLFMTTVAKCAPEKFGFVRMPGAQPDFPTCSQGGIALVIPTGAAHPPEGWKFIEYLQGAEPTGIICSGLINCAQVTDAMDYPAYRDNPILKLATETSKNAKAFPGYLPVASEYTTELKKSWDLIVRGKAEAEVELQGIYDRLQPELDKALGKA